MSDEQKRVLEQQLWKIPLRMLIFFLFPLLISCRHDYETRYYRAISDDKRDTALLKVVISESAGFFYGDYQIRYNGVEKDDGTIRGQIFGDTLIGKFNYLSRENVKKAAPIAFLTNENSLKLGKGTAGTYLGLNVYKYGTITFDDSLFQFQPIDAKEPGLLKYQAPPSTSF